MSPDPMTRRSAIARLLVGTAAIGTGAVPARVLANATGGSTARISDGVLSIDFDAAAGSRLSFAGSPITAMAAADAVRLADGRTIDRFLLLEQTEAPIAGPHGAGRRLHLRATAGCALERQVDIALHDRYPGAALIDTAYRNTGQTPLTITGWRTLTHDLMAHPKGAWSFAGASYPNRRDWIQPVAPGFEQRNFMGMNGSDYGGGTPVAVVWRPDVALSVGHVDTVPRLVSLPVAAQPGGTRIGMSDDTTVVLAPGETLRLPPGFVMVHRGDHFASLDAYRRIMADRGLAAPAIPPSSYGPIWCAWGYERHFTPEEVYGTLPKARSMGFEWAVMDDGWQTSEGDWKLDPVKFPRGDADMKAFVKRIKADGMKPRLWLAPLAADPGTDLLRDHADMLLLDADGAAQNITWWNAFTLCPAYQPTIDYFRTVVRRIMGEWGFDGLKLDGQHLNSVAPCHNPAHRHVRPEESYEKLQDFWRAMYDEAIACNPQAVVEICPCGDSFAFHNIPAMNNTPASDPESSWQVRLKGKTFKALMGPAAPFSGDHVELSDGGDDFASTYGIGAIPSTKFTWPRPTARPTDKMPADGFLLTPAKEALWRQWLDLYARNRLAEGRYLGGLYDIGFDKPEGHVVAKDGALHYAFYAKNWTGAVELRGLGTGDYILADGLTGRSMGRASAANNRIAATFAKFLLIVATPA